MNLSYIRKKLEEIKLFKVVEMLFVLAAECR